MEQSACGGWRRMWEAWRRPIRCGGGFTVSFSSSRSTARWRRAWLSNCWGSAQAMGFGDRSDELESGKTTINILMISVTWNGMGIPLLWMLLPTAGNSHTSERTELLDRLRAAFPDMKIAALMGDREFIGDAWMAYLQRQNIPFILRLRENQHVLREGYAAMSIAAIARHLRIGERMIVKGCCRLGRHDETLSSPVRLVVMRLASGELLALACSGSARHALARYRQRWTK